MLYHSVYHYYYYFIQIILDKLRKIKTSIWFSLISFSSILSFCVWLKVTDLNNFNFAIDWFFFPSKFICCKLIYNVMVFRSWFFGKRLGYEGRILLNMISVLIKNTKRISLSTCEGRVRRWPSMNQKAGFHLTPYLQRLNLRPFSLWDYDKILLFISYPVYYILLL